MGYYDTNYPDDFDIKLLRNLVVWARGENARLDKKFAKLGEFNWRQGSWAVQEKNGVCNTAFCMAGAAVVMSKKFKISWDMWYKDDSAGSKEREASTCHPKGKPEDVRDISITARDLIGLTQWEAETLFDGDNQIDDIEHIATEICKRRGKQLKV